MEKVCAVCRSVRERILIIGRLSVCVITQCKVSCILLACGRAFYQKTIISLNTAARTFNVEYIRAWILFPDNFHIYRGICILHTCVCVCVCACPLHVLYTANCTWIRTHTEYVAPYILMLIPSRARPRVSAFNWRRIASRSCSGCVGTTLEAIFDLL